MCSGVGVCAIHPNRVARRRAKSDCQSKKIGETVFARLRLGLDFQDKEIWFMARR